MSWRCQECGSDGKADERGRCDCQIEEDQAKKVPELEAETVLLRALLEETLGWLCPHTDAIERFKTQDLRRSWCVECSEYLRSDADITLLDRINEALGSK